MWPQNQKAFKLISVVTIALSFWCTGIVYSQALEAPVMGNACITSTGDASDTATFTAPIGLPASTTYSLQLSNESGSFITGTQILDRKTAPADRRIVFSFEYPQSNSILTFGSDAYNVRVIIENQTEVLPGQIRGPISIFVYNGEILDLEPRQICELSNNPQLRAEDDLPEYRWYRNEILIPGETGRVLNVTQPGDYHYRPFLGNCGIVNISGARSNISVVAEMLGNLDIDISSSGSPSICASETLTLQIDNPQPNFDYQWVKDGREISGATGPTFDVTGINSGGNYTLEVLNRDDNISRCTSVSNDIQVVLQNPSIEIVSEVNIVSIPGVENQLRVITTGGAPKVITWIRNGIDIPNSNSETFVTNEPGIYKARVSATSPCTINTVTTVNQITIVSADNLNIVLEYDNPNYSDCALSRIGLRISSITSEINGETITASISNFPENTISWLVNGAVSPQFSGASILVENAGANGTYIAQIDTGLATFESNALGVKLNPGELMIEADPNSNLDDNNTTVELSVPLSDDAILSLYTYRWFRIIGLAQEEQISTSSTVQISEPGTYGVEITFDDCPPVRLNNINISSASVVIPNVLTPNGFNNTKWKLPLDLTNQPNVNVQIISSSGKEVLNQNNYNGNWPDQELTESIYYYIISRNNNPFRKGTITIIR